jgi:hypothetical protein
MPNSSWEHADWAVERFVQLHDGATVVDVGPGSGKWSKLLRDGQRRSRGDRWIGLEVHAPYVERFNLPSLYDEVVVGDVRDEPDLLLMADVVILGDVLEHLEEQQARDLCAALVAAGVGLLVAGPIVEYPQGSWEGNDHEAHLWHPTPQDWIDMVQPDEHILGDPCGTFWRWPRGQATPGAGAVTRASS